MIATEDFAPGLDRLLRADVRDERYEVTDIRGEIPPQVRGTYYVIGPGAFERFGLQYRHWLDADGIVSSLRFADDGLQFTRRYVASRKRVREAEAERPLFRAFGTSFPGDQLLRGLNTESPINVAVQPYGERLLAFGEQSLPYELDPLTLDTLTPGEPYDFGGAINEMTPFSAHAKLDATTEELVNFGVSFASREPRLNFYRIGFDGRLKLRTHVTLPYAASIHDFALARRHVVFHVGPQILDFQRMSREGCATAEALTWQRNLGSSLLVLDRETGREVARLPVAPYYCLHVIAAFERDGFLICDLIEYDGPIYEHYQVLPSLFVRIPAGRPVRYAIDLNGPLIVARQEAAYAQAPDFPTLDPRHAGLAYSDCWMLGISATGRVGRKFFDRLVHVNWGRSHCPDVFRAPSGHFLTGEPAYIPFDDQDDSGAVLAPFFDSQNNTSGYWLFEPSQIAAGPLAEIRLQGPDHAGFHAAWWPS